MDEDPPLQSAPHDEDPLSTDELVAAFDAAQIEAADFPHRRHVKVAWALVRRYDAEEAFARLVIGIRGIATRAGRADAYHETITRAWFELIRQSDDLAHDPALFDKQLLRRYYSDARLAAGREEWLDPDLHPLELPPPAMPTTSLEAVLRRIPTAVAVLGTSADHTVHATTVSSFASVSREPALVSVCVANGSRTLDLLVHSTTFALSVLASDQREVAARFAEAERPPGLAQFHGVPHRLTDFGPVIDTAAAWLGCHVHALHECGDHHIVVGEVADADVSEQIPLVRHDGAYR